MGTTATGTRVDASTGDAARGRTWPWLARVLALVVVFAIIAWGRSRQVDIPFRDPHGKLFQHKILSSLGLLAGFVVLDVVVRGVRRARREAEPVLRASWSVVRDRWTAHRVGLTLLGLVAYYVVYLCYRNLKSWDVFRTPKDAMLLRWDRWLFLDHSPAVLLHDLFGQHTGARVLTDIYESFPTLVTVSLIAALAFAPRVRDSFVFITAAMWAWILGVGSYYLIPSLGPFHQAPDEFAGLTRTSIQTTQAAYVDQRAYLLAHPQAGDAFAQISAFASLHCALTALIWLMARYYGLRRLSWLIGLFLIGTLLATVYLGWHYAVDDLAGLLIAAVSVWLGRLMVTGRRNPATPDPAAS